MAYKVGGGKQNQKVQTLQRLDNDKQKKTTDFLFLST